MLPGDPASMAGAAPTPCDAAHTFGRQRGKQALRGVEIGPLAGAVAACAALAALLMGDTQRHRREDRS
jgi:hypothetical protein